MYALILAGGRGERLRPYTEDRPKQMVPINGKPILEYQLEWLRQEGVDHAVILCGYLHQVIMDYFGDGQKWGIHIDYSVEDNPLGRGGALKKGFFMVPKGERLVIGLNGDNIIAQSLKPMLEAHEDSGALVTVMLAPLRSPYGIATLTEDNHIVGFEEKPVLPYWLNAGVYIISCEAFQLFPDLGDHEDTTFPQLAGEGRLYGFKSTAYWKPIDTVKDLTEASAALKELQLFSSS